MNYRVKINGRSMKGLLLLAGFLSLVASSVCNATPSKNESEQIFGVVEILKSLPTLDRNSIESVLKIKFSERADSNQYSKFYEANIEDGPISSIEITEPQKGSTAKDLRATINLKRSARVTLDDVQKRYGQGKIEQIIPEAGPEGVVTYSFLAKDGALYFSVTAKTHQVKYVVVVKKSS